MAGHSKWKNIQHRKGAQDKKRAKAFQIASKEIIVAMQNGGTDLSNNPRLKLAIDKAKAANVPKDNIQKLIDKSNKDKTNYSEIIYEGYAPGGVAIIIDCLTDNVNRTVSKVKATLTKKGGQLATTGAVSYLFETKGIIIVDNSINEDKVMEVALNNDAINFESEDEIYIIETSPKNWQKTSEAIKELGYKEFIRSEIARVPSSTVSLDETKREKVENLIEELEDLEDVSYVTTNLD